MLAACPCFQSGPTEWTEGGTNRHRYLHLMHLLETIPANDFTETSNPKVEMDALAARMSEEEIDACVWAHDYIKLKAALLDHPIYFERKMAATLPDFSTIDGTPDVTCGADLFDLKWRERDYSAQMAAYVLMIFEANPKLEYVRVHILFGAFKRVAPVYSLTQEQAERIVEETIERTKIHRVESGNEAGCVHTITPQPRTCDYCGWCSKQTTCPAVTAHAKTVAVGYSDGKPPEITSWHPSDMTTPEQIAFALMVWRTILKKWGESIEFHALEAARTKGFKLPGYELVPSKGKSAITDVPAAFALAGIPQEEFFKACEIRMNTSKTYPDRVGLTEIFAEKNGLKKAPAKKELLRKLESVIQPGKDGFRLKAVNEETEEN